MRVHSIFRSTEGIFNIVEFGVDNNHDYVRCMDESKNYYDFKVKNTTLIETVGSRFDLFKVVTNANYQNAMVSYNEDMSLPPVGNDGREIMCELVSKGRTLSPIHVGSTTLFNDPNAGKGVPFAYSVMPEAYRDTTDDPNEISARRSKIVGFSSTPDGKWDLGAGTNTMGFSSDGQFSTNANSSTSSTQEVNPAGGMLTTSLNFLHHYFIGIANTVALPMPHMVNLVKMVAIGKFAKNMIGTKKKVKMVDGVEKTTAGTGIFGLVDEIQDIANPPKKDA